MCEKRASSAMHRFSIEMIPKRSWQMSEKRRFTLFFMIVALQNMAASFAHPVTPTLFKGLQLSDSMFGLVLAAMLTVNFLFSPFWGKISTYISSRNTLMICNIGYAVGQLFFGLAKTSGQFLLARMFAGIFTGGNTVGALTYIVNTSPDTKSRERHLVISATLLSVCGSFGFFVGGMLGEIHVYVAIAAQVGTLATCGVLYRLVCKDDTMLPLRGVNRKELVRQANPFEAFVQSGKFMTVTLAFLFAMCALQNLCQTTFDQSFNYYAIDQIGFSTGYNGAVKFVMGITTLIANSTLCMWIMNRTDTNKSIIAIMLCCCVTMAIILMLDALVPYLIANVLYFAMSSISVPILQNMVAEVGRRGDSNLIMGFYNAMKSLGGIFGALIAGLTYAINPRMPFICCLIAFAIAALCGVVYARRSSAARKVNGV